MALFELQEFHRNFMHKWKNTAAHSKQALTIGTMVCVLVMQDLKRRICTDLFVVRTSHCSTVVVVHTVPFEFVYSSVQFSVVCDLNA